MLTGHGSFGHFLWRIQKHQTKACFHCACNDTAEHTLADCPAREDARASLMTKLNIDQIANLTLINVVEKMLESKEQWNSFESKKKDKKGRGIAIVLLFLTNDKKERHVNLLYLYDKQRDTIAHFAYIKNLSRLVRSQLTAGKNKVYICNRCALLLYEKLSAHSVDCGKMNDRVIVLPNDDEKWLAFRNYDRKERIPFVVYADLECAMEKEEEGTSDTFITQHHKAFSVGYYVRCAYDDSKSMYRSNRGEKCGSSRSSTI
ncbi:hypothetical protein RF55_9122 [Lasius niger]|uniref:Reverse transcriptase n=1 Tax=Lasius niger TaxID=67767 RepID=A0A0J7KLH4_LASNI|nr:hypothetical protein RF55_9122 [Lasius niger]